MKNILVTGGAGFIGSHTVVELASNGFNPIIVDNLSNSRKTVIKNIEKIIKKPIVFFEHDYSDAEFLKKLVRDEEIEGVIHFAAFKSVNESLSQPLKYYQNNVAGFVTLLKVLSECNVNRLIFSSSATVYGEPDNLPINENSPVKPSMSPYGTSKQMCEKILQDLCNAKNTFSAFALRYFNPIGAHKSYLIGELPIGKPNNLVPFLTQAVDGLHEKITIFGDDYDTEDGTCVRDYIHVVDLAKAHVCALKKLNIASQNNYDVVNIGTGSGNSVMQVISSFSKVNGKKVPYDIGPRRDGDVASCYADVSKANKILNWQSELSLEDALLDAWNWQKTIIGE